MFFNPVNAKIFKQRWILTAAHCVSGEPNNPTENMLAQSFQFFLQLSSENMFKITQSSAEYYVCSVAHQGRINMWKVCEVGGPRLDCQGGRFEGGHLRSRLLHSPFKVSLHLSSAMCSNLLERRKGNNKLPKLGRSNNYLWNYQSLTGVGAWRCYHI